MAQEFFVADEMKTKLKRFMDLWFTYDCEGDRSCLSESEISFLKRSDYNWWTSEGYRGKTYIYIKGGFTRYIMDPETGTIYTFKNTRAGRPKPLGAIGNIDDFINPRRKWGASIQGVRRVHMVPSGMKYEPARREETRDLVIVDRIRKCSICLRTDNVRKTRSGLLCNYCRGSATRHMNSIIALGGVPINI